MKIWYVYSRRDYFRFYHLESQCRVLYNVMSTGGPFLHNLHNSSLSYINEISVKSDRCNSPLRPRPTHQEQKLRLDQLSERPV